jgi:hypothetical protein
MPLELIGKNTQDHVIGTRTRGLDQVIHRRLNRPYKRQSEPSLASGKGGPKDKKAVYTPGNGLHKT